MEAVHVSSHFIKDWRDKEWSLGGSQHLYLWGYPNPLGPEGEGKVPITCVIEGRGRGCQ